MGNFKDQLVQKAKIFIINNDERKLSELKNKLNMIAEKDGRCVNVSDRDLSENCLNWLDSEEIKYKYSSHRNEGDYYIEW